VLYSDPCCTKCLAYIRGGIFGPTYIRRSDVSVSARIGALQIYMITIKYFELQLITNEIYMTTKLIVAV